MIPHPDELSVHPDGDDLFCLDTMIAPRTDFGGGLPARRERHDGWTPAKQRQFLQMLAEGHTITNSCAALGMSTSSAYALRRSAAGAAFALGWQAALLLAREHLADRLLERAMHGSVDTITRPDGTTVTRQRHDNRLAMHMLSRLDRLAEEGCGPADHAAARLVAGEFEQFLALVAGDGGAARAGLFLARRAGGAGGMGTEAADELAAVRALARADAWLRTGADACEGVAVGDLDPAQRAGWSAEQWARAEAAGLLVLAPPPKENAQGRELWQLGRRDNPNGDPVWCDSDVGEWRTSFPPPDDFYGEEFGEYGEPDYARELSPEELEVLEAPLRAAREARRVAAAQERDAFFADGVDVIEVDAHGVPLWGAVATSVEQLAPIEAASSEETRSEVSEALSPPRSSSPRRRGSIGAGAEARAETAGRMDSRLRGNDEGGLARAAPRPDSPPPPASSHPGTVAVAPGLTPPADAPISPPARTRGASKRQRIREGTMPSNDQSSQTAPARAAARI
ncbi:hypothetical protein [Sphingomonas pokkalii]|uniref:Uncharacterized protein n=1 Tax=Sphingomonas pokkalii TaxID=2175090 RepID=A0A2U0SG21_9SPHN|nr:hypothetical protein [Sphingomonas pokkalii]PVX30215.1 hypothetical protein DD559_13465 [Sphingomonas pokkalii]